MARYISEEEFIAWVREHWCSDCPNDNGLRCRACWIDDAIDIVEEAPTADVAPRAEVDLYKKLNNELEDELASTYDKLENAKAEIAREIFAEIESKIKDDVDNITENINQIEDPDAIDGQYEEIATLEWVLDFLAEFKKKYTDVPDINVGHK